MLVNPAIIVEVAATAAYFGGCFFVLRYLKRLNRKYGIDVDKNRSSIDKRGPDDYQ